MKDINDDKKEKINEFRSDVISWVEDREVQEDYSRLSKLLMALDEFEKYLKETDGII